MDNRNSTKRERITSGLASRLGLQGLAASLLGGLGVTAAEIGAAAEESKFEGLFDDMMEKSDHIKEDALRTANRAAGRDARPERDSGPDADGADRAERNNRAVERDADEPRRRSSEQESDTGGDEPTRRRDARQETDGNTDPTTDAGSDTNGGGGRGANDAGDADADADGDSIEMSDINTDDDFDVQQVISNLNLSEFGADDGDGDVIATTGPDGAVAISGDSIARSGPGGSFAQSGDSIASSGPDGATAISGGGNDADAGGGDNNDFAS